MELSETPEILYRYSFFKWAKAILEDCRILVTPPHKFNDPFEILPSGRDNITKRERYKTYNRCNKIVIKRWLSQGRVKNMSEGKKLYKEQSKKLLPQLVEEVRDWRGFKREFCKRIGILCLSEVFDDILMWSHYANSHQGVVIGFDPQKLLPPFFPVDYSENRVKVSLSSRSKSKEKNQTDGTLVLTKSKHWEYEKEWRAMYELNSLEKDGEKYFLKFSKEAIKEVIIGAETPDAKRTKIAQLVKNNYPNAKIKQAELSLEMFALKINNLAGHPNPSPND